MFVRKGLDTDAMPQLQQNAERSADMLTAKAR
jgi:hypothetical protein